MSCNNKVAWEEGIFLSPQHLQQHDRYFENLINQKTTGVLPYFWGVKELKIDKDILTVGKFCFIHCSGILPDGTFFDSPTEDDLPASLVIADTVINKYVYLGIPSKQPGVQDVNSAGKDKDHRYFVINKEISDSVVGYDEKIEVPLAKLTLQLFLEGQDLSNYTCIPIAFIKEAQVNQKIILNDEFIPPCFTVSAVPRLTKFIHEVHSLLHHRGEMLSHRLNDQQQSQATMMIDFMLLQLINRYELNFSYLKDIYDLHPMYLFERLIQLMGELATFTKSNRRPVNIQAYNHYEITKTFQPIIAELRKDLSMVLEQDTTAIPLTQHQHGIWLASIENKDLLKSTYFVLAVYAEVPLETIRAHFVKQAKVAPVEQLQQLITRQLPGIELQLMSTAPRQIPFHANYVYFNLNKNHESWQYLDNSAALGIYLGASYPNPKLELWAIKE